MAVSGKCRPRRNNRGKNTERKPRPDTTQGNDERRGERGQRSTKPRTATAASRPRTKRGSHQRLCHDFFDVVRHCRTSCLRVWVLPPLGTIPHSPRYRYCQLEVGEKSEWTCCAHLEGMDTFRRNFVCCLSMDWNILIRERLDDEARHRVLRPR